MDNLQLVRINIDDHVQIGVTTEISLGKNQVFQMNNHNIWSLVITDSDGEVIPPKDDEDNDNYIIFPQAGQVEGEFPEGEITFRYQFAGFTDVEIQHYLDANGDSVNKATLACLKILLASAAKRFDYKAGLKDIKASQIYNHLKDLKETFEEAVSNEDETGDNQVPIFIDRIHPAYIRGRQIPDDISRRDS